MAGGQILAFPIDFDRRPYNTLALPCECVISLTSLADDRQQAGVCSPFVGLGREKLQNPTSRRYANLRMSVSECPATSAVTG